MEGSSDNSGVHSSQGWISTYTEECNSRGMFRQVNVKANNGMTPLHVGAKEGHKDVVELPLTNGGDANAQDDSGRMPLELATAMGQKAEADLLRQHGGHE
jgi:ankyrin repeat protein